MDEETLTGSLYPNIIRAVYQTPWAIMPDTLRLITEVVDLRSHGQRFTAEEIDARVAAAMERSGPRNGPRRGVVAVIPVYGTIMPRAGLMSRMSGGTSVEEITAMLRDAYANADVNSIVMEYDSPGGQVDGVPELAAEIQSMRQSAGGSKPIVAHVNTLAASAAYWLASAADEIVAAPSAQLGHIGVILPHVDTSAADAAAGKVTTLISAGKYKTEGQYGPLTEEAVAAMQERVNGYYDMMVGQIAKGRGVKIDVVRSGYGEGRVLLARPALAQGMIDRVDTLDNTVRRLARGGAIRTKTDQGGEDPLAASMSEENLSAGTGREAFADRLSLAAEEIKEVVAHARDRAALRAEEGRKLSEADVDGLRQIAGLRSVVDEADDMVLKRLGPEAAEAAKAGSLKPVLDARLEAVRRGYSIPKS